MSRTTSPIGFGKVLRIREYRALWFADTVSVLGDQLMRVSVSLLVYYATRSAATTALVYALTFLPTLIGGATLSGLADRFPRRRVMIVTDLARAALFALMALPSLSLPVVCILLVVAVLLGSPFRAAQTATLPDVLPGELYAIGLAVRTISLQGAQLAGYAVGGIIATALNPRAGLLIDAGTFVVSGLLLAVRVENRPVPARERRHAVAWRDYAGGISDGYRLIAHSRRLRILAGLAFMSGFYVVPEGLAAPYATAIGGGSVSVGLLMAADPAGSVAGAWLMVRLVPAAVQNRLMAVLAIGPGLVLLLCGLGPSLWVSLLIWIAAGTMSVFQIPASVAFVRDLPDTHRGQALGLVTSGMLAAQGLGVLAAGGLASASSPTTAIAVAGGAGSVVAALLAWRWRSAHDLAPAVVVADSPAVA